MTAKRLASIDVFRAITMFLMVFVNDLWTLENVPKWLKHAPASADAMGFSDIIFPAFLFIVGLSIPFAQENRISKGDSRPILFQHILLRSLALLVMGFFHVNMESYSTASLLPEAIWKILVTIAFFMVWLDYPKEKDPIAAKQGKKRDLWLQLSGVALLLLMAFLYKGEGQNGHSTWMQIHWWGILGLIGLAYLSCATLFLLLGEKLALLSGCLLFFAFFNVSAQLGSPEFMQPFTNTIGELKLGNGAHASLVMAGIISSVVYRKLSEKPIPLALVFIGTVGLFFAFGFATRPWWGISKIQATPSWTSISAGISLLAFGILIFLVDFKEKKQWFKLLKPAGTSTLTCYLLPYFHLAIFISLLNLHLPLFLRTGSIGILKSLIFAFLIVLLTGWLEKKRIRLKI